MMILGITPYGIDVGPFGMVFAGLLFSWAIMSRRFLVLLPVARELVIESLHDGIVILDTMGKVVDFNPAAASMLGLLGGCGREDIVAALEGPEFEPELSPLIALGEGERELEGPSARGEPRRRIRAKAFAVKDARTRPIGACLVLSDVTETAMLVDKLAELASIDGLTGALNRRRLEEIGERDIELARRSGESIGVLMVDIDFFKLVNDDWGHAAGDEVLKEICRRCKADMRSSDSFGRIGGEEFAVVLPSSDAEGALAAAERLRVAVSSSPIAWEGKGIAVTVSVGVFVGVPAEGEAVGLFLRRADDALYAAKQTGRNRTISWDVLGSR
jgi:diguanylate cyclase (GGDEF)-like protein